MKYILGLFLSLNSVIGSFEINSIDSVKNYVATMCYDSLVYSKYDSLVCSKYDDPMKLYWSGKYEAYSDVLEYIDHIKQD